MNDQLIMDNYLLILKSAVEVYVHGTLEASNNDIRMDLKDNLNKIMACQARTYDEMTKYGWYQVNNVDATMITQTLNKVQSSN